eukprot:2700942-Pyramimonas_sp.AAC.1
MGKHGRWRGEELPGHMFKKWGVLESVSTCLRPSLALETSPRPLRECRMSNVSRERERGEVWALGPGKISMSAHLHIEDRPGAA